MSAPKNYIMSFKVYYSKPLLFKSASFINTERKIATIGLAFLCFINCYIMSKNPKFKTIRKTQVNYHSNACVKPCVINIKIHTMPPAGI